MTKQKALLLSIFHSDACRGRHRTAEELLAFAKDRMPGISRATIYNNLKALEQDGIIRKISIDGGADVYDASRVLHAHLICSLCGEIRDLETPMLLGQLEKLSGTVIDSYELKLSYVCGGCRVKKQKAI